MSTRVWILLSLTLFLTACGTDRVVQRPEVVRVVERVYIPVPEDLVQEIPKTSIEGVNTYGDALEAWANDRAIIDALNGQLRGIGSLNERDDSE